MVLVTLETPALLCFLEQHGTAALHATRPYAAGRVATTLPNLLPAGEYTLNASCRSH